jgi:hypothetical protein
MSETSESKDQDRGKGAVEQDDSGHFGNTSMQGQIGHRDQDAMLKSADTDFPEPGENAEHTGQAQDPDPRKLDEVAKKSA